MTKTKVRVELEKVLRKVYDDDDFVLGVLLDAKNEENFKILLDFIKEGKNVTPANVIMLSLDLHNGGREYYEKYWKEE